MAYFVNEISEVSLLEQIKVTATIESIFNNRWHCHTCLTKHQYKDNYEEYTEKERDFKRCRVVGDVALAKLEHFEFYTCVGNFTCDATSTLVDWFMKYQEHGLLPFSGGVADQPYKVIQYFQMIDSIRNAKTSDKEKAGGMPDRVKDKLNRKRAKDG